MKLDQVEPSPEAQLFYMASSEPYEEACDDHSSDSTDDELLEEALIEEDEEDHDSKGHEGGDIDEKDFEWMRPTQYGAAKAWLKLELPVAIPQTAPGLKPLFSRAYAPVLDRHDVRLEEFVAFIDHLNVCKSASPPLQILGLAGLVLGFMPIPYAYAIGLGVGVANAAAEYATAYFRLKNYIVRSNEQYFIPRGLLVRIAKQALFKDIVKEPENETPVAPAPDIRSGQHSTLRDRRLMALERRIASLQFDGLPVIAEENNILDKWSKSQVARSTQKKEDRQERKGGKAAHRAERRMRNLDEKREETLTGEQERKLARREAKIHRKFEKRNGGRGTDDKTSEEAKKFLWIVVEDLETGLARLKNAKYEAAASRLEDGATMANHAAVPAARRLEA